MTRKFVYILCVLLVVSCSSTESLYVSQAGGGGQLCFLRPMNLESKSSVFKSMEFDLTLNIQEKDILYPPVFNYTLTLPFSHIKDGEDLFVTLGSENLKVGVESKKQLFRDIEKGDTIRLRYSVELNKEDFLSLLNDSDNSCVVINQELIKSKDLVENLNKIKMLML